MLCAMESTRIVFIGGGNMARSLVGGLVADGVPPGRLGAAEPDAARRAALQRDFGIEVFADNAAAAAQAEVVVLAVKPQVMPQAARAVAPSLAARSALVISIAAGIRTAELLRWLGAGTAVVRAMPNTPALLGCGATVLYAGDGVAPAQRELAESILRAVGSVSWVERETQMDAVTALSGSGPAYFFLLIEAMADAAAELGLPQDLAGLLAVETALGAARMALESDEPVAALRRRVTSPGGTTEAALDALEAGDFRTLVATALQRAEARSRELADRFAQE
ncbi:pyrroline-5-carboxylate reductase [Thioalkalivibrio sp. XN279]|uniref:pyrroline-5-carboxylate reductase n=1 Tax=Thioalkalivibrio sp. XN279 TaxID=2714953 RepID=UPI001F0DDD7F|nr:pyrroline-5-carboxylate reductase [Thioalkalivibrio sp. XN279]